MLKGKRNKHNNKVKILTKVSESKEHGVMILPF
jgi:hypothetical protein